jgi:glucose/mannose-6-phosphate isomerase
MKMDGHIEGFKKQLQEAVNIAIQAKLTKKSNVNQVLVTGLGGSGIGGSVVNELVQDNCTVPIIVNKDYFLPSFVSEKTLVVISSYSGNTEETLNCFEQAIRNNAQIVCVTSGGKVAEIAKKNGFDLVIVPGGNPPRTCLGYSVVQLLNILKFNGFISLDVNNLIADVVQLLENEKNSIRNEAIKVASTLKGKIPVIYTLGNTESIAFRFRQQINENSKMLCWHNVIPEMNHNEIVGWRREDSNIAVIVLRTDYEFEKNSKRLSFCKNVISTYTSNYTELFAKGKNRFEQFFYLIHLTDWISYELALINEVDPIEVHVIDQLKSALAG